MNWEKKKTKNVTQPRGKNVCDVLVFTLEIVSIVCIKLSLVDGAL